MPEADTGAAPGKAGGSDAVRLKAFVDRVVERSGAKKKDARPLVEAVLAVLGEALHAGEELNLPPLGKIKVNRQKDTSGGEMLIVRLKRGGARPGAGKAAGAAPADAADADDDAADD
jgi:DNA-binding protein HU-alpha